jgi:predicted DNA-binding antitoxin AbrB/MazE fold protein
MGKTKRKKLRGRVERVLKPLDPREPEKAQINIQEADNLYREVRVENSLTDEDGEKVRLKVGAEVDVVLEADSDATIRKPF